MDFRIDEEDDPLVMLAKTWNDPTVETVLTFGRKLTANQIPPLMFGPLQMFQIAKRQDRHEDGSISTTYYLELTEEQYKRLGGE